MGGKEKGHGKKEKQQPDMCYRCWGLQPVSSLSRMHEDSSHHCRRQRLAMLGVDSRTLRSIAKMNELLLEIRACVKRMCFERC